jgi:lipopolysaccharide biosynthesis glycosyltransferase
MAFAAGTLALSLLQRMPYGDFDIIVINEGLSSPAWHDPGKEVHPQARKDAELLASLPRCRLLDYSPEHVSPGDLQNGPPVYYLYIFEMFRLLAQYRSLVWLDIDVVVQDDITELFDVGPLGMSLHDFSFLREGAAVYTVARNFKVPVPGYDMDAPIFNSGVVCLRDDMPLPLNMYEWCLSKYVGLIPLLRHKDQAILNLFALDFPELVRTLPFALYNCYPHNKKSDKAKIVHSFGPQKTWNSALLQLAFPEWTRTYHRWLALGGSPYTGRIGDAPLLEHSACSLIIRCLAQLEKRA